MGNSGRVCFIGSGNALLGFDCARNSRLPKREKIRYKTMAGLKFFLELPLVVRQRRLSSERKQMTKEEFVRGIALTEIGKSAAALL